MKNKIITFLRNFFSQYLKYLDIAGGAGFAAGIILYFFAPQAGIIILTVFALLICVYHILHFGYLSRFAEDKSSLEQFITTMMGFSIAIIAIGSVIKLAGITEKDKILNIGLITSVLCDAIVLLYYILKSEQLKIKQVPFIRNTVACVVGVCFFLIPLKTKEDIPALYAPQMRSEQVLKEKNTVDTTQGEEQVELPSAEEETDSTQ